MGFTTCSYGVGLEDGQRRAPPSRARFRSLRISPTRLDQAAWRDACSGRGGPRRRHSSFVRPFEASQRRTSSESRGLNTWRLLEYPEAMVRGATRVYLQGRACEGDPGDCRIRGEGVNMAFSRSRFSFPCFHLAVIPASFQPWVRRPPHAVLARDSLPSLPPPPLSRGLRSAHSSAASDEVR